VSDEIQIQVIFDDDDVSQISVSSDDNIDYITVRDFILMANDKYYRHVQSTPASTWTITHNLGKKCSVVIYDSTMERQVIGETHYIDDNNLQVIFASSFSGEAYCN